jgi:hypothetical protein
MPTRDDIGECLRDIDPEFIKTTSRVAAWEYNRLFEELVKTLGLSDEYRQEEFNRRRGDCLVRALLVAAKEHGVPFEFLKLASNGQSKLLLKCGRVVIFQEAVFSLSDAPKVTEYKLSLAATHSLVCQLELDLGDIPGRVTDWDGGVLGVLLHGSRGVSFNQESKELGVLMLAVPDAAYSHWLVRIDLHSIAVDGISMGSEPMSVVPKEAEQQPDNVHVTLKRRTRKEAS